MQPQPLLEERVLEVDQVLRCKRLHAQGVGIRAIARMLEISRGTVRSYLRGDRQPGEYRMTSRRAQPVRDALRERVLELLVEEQRNQTPRKQRLTAARIHRLLVGVGETASESVVRRLVRELRDELRDPLEHAYLTLEYEPGRDAQVDFFEAEVLNRHLGRVKCFVLLVRACFSTRTYAYAAPNQTREALLEGLMRAFEYFGGVFDTMWFDNLTPAVKKVLKGRDRELQQAFVAFQAHYGFKAEFCGPGKGNEKGGVEGAVKYGRHEIFSPMPSVDGRTDVQALCDAYMEREMGRRPRGRSATVGEMWALEESELAALPATRFVGARVHQTKVTPRSWVAVGTNQYSVPVEWVGTQVSVRLEAEEIVILHPKEPPVRHPRCYGRQQMQLTLDHYLPLLRRKPRGIDRCVAFRRWMDEAGPDWAIYLELLRKRKGEVAGCHDFIDTLMLCRHWGEKKVEAAVKQVLAHPDVSMASVRYFLWRDVEVRRSEPTAITYEGPAVRTSSASAYMALCQEGSR